MKITAAVHRASDRPFVLEEVELAEPRPDEILVRLVASGICHTDLVAAGGVDPSRPPQVFGHEGAGIVAAVGAEVSSVQPGDHVVISYAWCGTCANCMRGRMAYCDTFLLLNYFGTRADGTSSMIQNGNQVNGHFFGQSSWATHSLTTERNVVRVDPDLPFEYLAPLGCGVQTGAGAVLNTLAPEPDSTLAVFALGGVGLSAVMAARIAGCQTIIGVDPNPLRRTLALELGATHVIDPTADNPVKALRALAGGAGVDYSVECVGHPDVVQAAVSCLAAPGMCVTVGFQGLSNPVELDQVAIMGGRGIRGSVEGDAIPQRFIPALIDHYRAGRLPLEKLVRTFSFAQINEAVAASNNGDVVKPVLIF